MNEVIEKIAERIAERAGLRFDKCSFGAKGYFRKIAEDDIKYLEKLGYHLIPKELKVLSLDEMKDAIWAMGCKAEDDKKTITQAMRFMAIAQAQVKSIQRQCNGSEV